VLGGSCTVTEVPIPSDCTDGWVESFYARPERLLDEEVRRSQSAWAFVDAAPVQRCVERLRLDLESGEWDLRYGAFRTQPELLGSLRLIEATPS
jgi:hypothetical protein